jgi:hypothetical protein
MFFPQLEYRFESHIIVCNVFVLLGYRMRCASFAFACVVCAFHPVRFVSLPAVPKVA